MSQAEAETRQMLKACHQYYRRGLTHTQIAANLGTTRFAVARMLRTAMDGGMVMVKILETESLHPTLEEELEVRFGLRTAMVVDAGDLSEIDARTKVADAAGRHLVQTITDGDVIGVSLGATIQSLVDQLPSRLPKQIEVVQLVGGDSSTLSAQLAERSKTRPYLLHAPAVVSEKEVRKVLLADRQIRATIAMFEQVSIAMLGVGSLTGTLSSRLLADGIIDPRLHRDLLGRNAVGDVLAYVFDAEGNVLETGLEDRFMSISLEQFRRIALRIGVAAGASKATAITGALRSGLINTVILDSRAAQAVLSGST